MRVTAIHMIELLVGLLTLAVAVPAWRGGGVWFRAVAVLLAAAGVAAIAHAVSSMLP